MRTLSLCLTIVALAACSASGETPTRDTLVARFLDAAEALNAAKVTAPSDSNEETEDDDFLRPMRAQAAKWNDTDRKAVESEVQRHGFKSAEEWLDVGDGCLCALSIASGQLDLDALLENVSKLENENSVVTDSEIRTENTTRFAKYRDDIDFCRRSAKELEAAASKSKPRLESLFGPLSDGTTEPSP